MRTDSRKDTRRLVTLAVLIAAIAVCIYSAYNITVILAEDASSSEVTQAARSFTHTAAPGEIPAAPAGAVVLEAPGEPVRETLSPQEPEAGPAYLVVDFDGLAEINSDVRAWIDIPGTDVSYPVVQTADDEYYLSHSFDGRSNRAGSIFLDSRSDSSLTGRNTVIYGHRMNNGSMFGSLNRLSGAAYRREHEYIHLYIPGAALPLTYQIFATWESPSSLDSLAYQVDFPDADAYSEWLNDLESRSFLTDLTLSPDDQILTLSTCVRGDGDTRFIVAARLLQ